MANTERAPEYIWYEEDVDRKTQVTRRKTTQIKLIAPTVKKTALLS